MNLCYFKNSFGKPNTGVHSIKIYNIAIIDFLITFLAAYLFYKIIKIYNRKIKYWKVLITLFILGIFFHYIFCVNTPLNKLLRITQ